MKELWEKFTGLIDIKLLKFLLVGCVNTLIGSGLLFGIYNILGLGYWLSSALSYVLASIVSYYLNRKFTFSSHSQPRKEIVKFALCIAVCYFIAYGVAQPLAKLCFASFSEKARDNLALLIGMCLFTGLNYIGQRTFVFKDDNVDS